MDQIHRQAAESARFMLARVFEKDGFFANAVRIVGEPKVLVVTTQRDDR